MAPQPSAGGKAAADERITKLLPGAHPGAAQGRGARRKSEARTRDDGLPWSEEAAAPKNVSPMRPWLAVADQPCEHATQYGIKRITIHEWQRVRSAY